MVAIPESERADFDDLLGSGGIFRKMLRTNPDGAQVGASPSIFASNSLSWTARGATSLRHTPVCEKLNAGLTVGMCAWLCVCRVRGGGDDPLLGEAAGE